MTKLYDTEKKEDLIYDVGMHKGEDTEYYLRKGFRVVAFEADPDLAKSCRSRLSEYLDQGKLTIVEGAIVDLASSETSKGKITFFKNDQNSVWGTICKDWAERNERLGASSSSIEVDVIDFVSIMRHYGVPYYLKIDVEGVDTFCVEALQNFQERPDYVSIESDKTSLKQVANEIHLFSSLGYDSFQAVEQSSIPDTQFPPKPAKEGKYVAQNFERGSSGLFGRELTGHWKSKHHILKLYRLILLGYKLLGDDGVLRGKKSFLVKKLRKRIRTLLSFITQAPCPGWYDTHARHSSANTR